MRCGENSWPKGGTTLQDVTFTRDATAKILTATSAGYADDSWTYTGACPGVGRGQPRPARDGHQCWQCGAVADVRLDADHNMVSNSLVGTYSYPTQGQSAVRPHAATKAGPYVLSYDAAGNMTRKLGGTACQTASNC